jgi:hypothetical protein
MKKQTALVLIAIAALLILTAVSTQATRRPGCWLT